MDRPAARETAQAASFSLATNAGLAVMKLVMGAVTGSISVLADGANSAGDVLTSLLMWHAVRQASRGADADHRYGHGKFESLSAAAESVIIVLAAAAIAWAAFHRLIDGKYGEFEQATALAVMAVSAATNLGVSLYLRRIALKHDSLALRAEAVHRGVDVWTSGGVFAGLALIALTGWTILDPLLAVGISLVILVQGLRVGREALGQLLDQALPAEEMDVIRQVLGEHDDMFLDYHRLRARKAGRQREIDLHLVTCPHVTVQEAHDLADRLEHEVSQRLSDTRMVIHVEPCGHDSCPNRGSEKRDAAVCALVQKSLSKMEK